MMNGPLQNPSAQLATSCAAVGSVGGVPTQPLPAPQLECNICLGSFGGDAAGALACGHTFCHRCLLKLLEQDDILCPTCRRPMEGIENINLGATIRSLKTLVDCGECHSKSIPVSQAKWCPQCCLLLCPRCDSHDESSSTGFISGFRYSGLDDHRAAGHVTVPWSPELAVRLCYEEWLAEEAQAQAWLESEKAKLVHLVEWIETKFIWLIIEEIAKRLYEAYVVRGAAVLERKLQERYKASVDACRAKMSRWKFMFSRDIADLSPPEGTFSENVSGYGSRKGTMESGNQPTACRLDSSASMVEIIHWKDASSSGVSTSCGQDAESNDDSFSVKLTEFQQKLKEQIMEVGAGSSSNNSSFSATDRISEKKFAPKAGGKRSTTTLNGGKRKGLRGLLRPQFDDNGSIVSQDEESGSSDLDEFVDTMDYSEQIHKNSENSDENCTSNNSNNFSGVANSLCQKNLRESGEQFSSTMADFNIHESNACSRIAFLKTNDEPRDNAISNIEGMDSTNANVDGEASSSLPRIDDFKMKAMIRNLLPKDIDEPSGMESGAAGRRHAVDLESSLTAIPIDLHDYDYRAIPELEAKQARIADLVGKEVVNRWTTPCLDRIMRGDYPNAWDNASRLPEDGQTGLDEGDEDRRTRLTDFDTRLSDIFIENATRNGNLSWIGGNNSGTGAGGLSLFGDRDVNSGTGGPIGSGPTGPDQRGLSPDDLLCHNPHCPSTSKNIFDGRAALDNFTVFQPKDLTVVPTTGDVVMACRNRGLLVFTSELEFKKAVVPMGGEFGLAAKDWRVSFVSANERTLFATREPSNILHSFDSHNFDLQPLAWKLPSLYQDFSVIRVNDTELFLLKSSQIYKIDLIQMKELAVSYFEGLNSSDEASAVETTVNERRSPDAGASSVMVYSDKERIPLDIPESMLTLLYHPDCSTPDAPPTPLTSTAGTAHNSYRPFYLRDICATLDSVFASASPYPDDEAELAGSDVYNRILQISPLDGSIVREFSSFPDYPDAYDALVLAVDLPNGLLFYNDSYGVRAVDLASGQRVGTTDDHAMLDGRLAAVDGHLYNVPHKYANGCEILLTGVDYDTKASDARGMLEYEPDNKPITGGSSTRGGSYGGDAGKDGTGSGAEDGGRSSERIWE